MSTGSEGPGSGERPLVRLGGAADVEAAVSVYERSNLARRNGRWPSRDERLHEVREAFDVPGSWFLVATMDEEAVGMALVVPFRGGTGIGGVVEGECFLSLIYVLPQWWGRRVGGGLLDAVTHEARRRSTPRIHLWTHELDNDRAQRLYRSRGFRRSGLRQLDDAGEPIAEWVNDVED